MTDILVLTEADVRDLLDPAELFDALEQAMVQLSAGTTSVPLRVAASTPLGLLGAMPGYVPGAGLAAKLVTVFPDNHTRSLPTTRRSSPCSTRRRALRSRSSTVRTSRRPARR